VAKKFVDSLFMTLQLEWHYPFQLQRNGEEKGNRNLEEYFYIKFSRQFIDLYRISSMRFV